MRFNLGLSSFQIEDADRGFSFAKEGPLDMRMDRSIGPLWQIINHLSEEEIGTIIRDFGEERFWRRIARAIVFERKKSPIKDTIRLSKGDSVASIALLDKPAETSPIPPNQPGDDQPGMVAS